MTRGRCAVAALAMLVLAFTLGRPPQSGGPLERDFEAYYAAGVTYDAGRDAYSRDIWTVERTIPGVDPNGEDVLPFVGPPAALVAYGILARLPYRAALAIWTVIVIAAAGALAAGAIRTVRRRERVRFNAGTGAALAILLVASAPVLSAIALGQAAIVAAGAVAVAAAVARRAPLGAAGAMLAAAVQPNLALVLAALVRTRRSLGAALLAAAAFVGLGLAAVGPAGAVRYFERLRAHGAAERDVTIQHTPAAVAHAFGMPASWAAVMGNLIAAGALLLVVVSTRRARLGPADGLLLACAALPWALPFFHEPDFALCMLPLLVLTLRARGVARRCAAIAAAAVLTDWFGLAGRPGAAAQIVLLGAAVMFAFTALDPARRARPDWTGPLAFTLLAAVAVPLGLTHPAPSWPDALPSGFHAAPNADVSQAWSEQADAAGLRAPVPAWGVLRAVPLAGCALLFTAVLLDARDRRRRPRDQMSTFIMSSNNVVALGRQPVKSEL